MKRCPDCAESVQNDARVCRYCGYRFSPETSQSPPLAERLASAGRQVAGTVRGLAEDAKDARAKHRQRVADLEALAEGAGLEATTLSRAASFIGHDETAAYLVTGRVKGLGKSVIVLTDRRVIAVKGHQSKSILRTNVVGAHFEKGRGGNRLRIETSDESTWLIAGVNPASGFEELVHLLTGQREVPESEAAAPSAPASAAPALDATGRLDPSAAAATARPHIAGPPQRRPRRWAAWTAAAVALIAIAWAGNGFKFGNNQPPDRTPSQIEHDQRQVHERQGVEAGRSRRLRQRLNEQRTFDQLCSEQPTEYLREEAGCP